MSGPLAGIRVIEFAGLGAGPFCGMMLADHGAEVIRIDRLHAQSPLFAADKDFLNRSRASFAVDLKSDDGIALARRLSCRADAVFESYRPGVMERLGLGPDVLLGDNPKLVYGRMTVLMRRRRGTTSTTSRFRAPCTRPAAPDSGRRLL